MKEPLVSIIIINMNGEDYLKICLPSLIKEVYGNKEIVIVDNGSTDGSVEFVKKNYSEIVVIENKFNAGFAGANNQGYKKTHGKYLFLLNNDTKIPKVLFKPLVDFMEANSSVGATQPRVLRQNEPEKLDSVGSFFTRSGFLYHFGFGHKDTKKLKRVRPLFSAKGCALMLRKSLIDRIGLFDEDFFAYFEETDLCWRIWLSGYKIFYIPDSYILHKGWGTTSRMNFSFINFHSYKNRIFSLIKNLSFKNLIIILPINIFLSVLASVASLFKGKFWESFSIWKAFYWLLMNKGKILKERKYVQEKIRKLEDSEFLPQLTKKVGPFYFFYLFTGLEKYDTTKK